MRYLIEFSIILYLSLTISGCGEVERSGSTGDSGPTEGNGSAELTWTKPTENTDDSALMDLEGFYIYFGSEDDYLTNTNFQPFSRYVDNFANSSNMTCENLDGGTRMTCTIDGLPENTNWYFAVTAVNGVYIQSNRSEIRCKQFMSTICLT